MRRRRNPMLGNRWQVVVLKYQLLCSPFSSAASLAIAKHPIRNWCTDLE